MRNIERNPFSQYSAEEELDILEDIFYKPNYYDDLINILSIGSSRFLLGQRGDGKSVVIHKIFKDLSRNHTLPLLITRYDSIPLRNNENYLLYKIMQALTIAICKHLFSHESDRKKLSVTQKQKLSFFIELYYAETFSDDFIESAKEIRRIKTRNWWTNIYNRKLIGIINDLINGAINITTQFIKQTIGLDGETMNIVYREYFRTIPTKEISSFSIDEVANWEREKLVAMLRTLIGICNSLDHRSIVILFDKIDEFQAINGDIDKITDFAIDILTDTDLLLSENLAIVFSLWSEVKRSLNKKGVRFDKFNEIDIRLRRDQLEPLINKRLFYFSVNKVRPVTLETLIPNQIDRILILDLSDRSPRSLIRLLGTIYNRHENHEDIEFSSSSISNGIIEFCEKFDYESLQPSKLGNRNDLIGWINRLLRIRKNTFTLNDLNKVFSQKATTSSKHIETFIKLGLIEENLIRGEHEEIQYDIIDPRIKHLISRNILRIGQ